MRSPSMEPAAAAVPRGGYLGRVRVACGARAPRCVVGAGLAVPGRRRVLVTAFPEPLDPLLLAQEGAAELEPEADDVHGDVPDVAPAAISSRLSVPGRTVRVKFVLNKKCTFGQSFHLVGDDPALGLWDLSKAIALDWSEGHDWTVEKDLPVNRLIEFKLLLQDSSGNLHWQNGPNRSLRTGETANKLVVCEDWDDIKNQKIGEEEDPPVGLVETFPDEGKSRNGVILANELQVDDDVEMKDDESSVGEDDVKSKVSSNISVQGKSVKAHETDQTEVAGQTEVMVNGLKIQDELCDKLDTAPQNSCVTTCADDDYAERIDDGSILSKDGDDDSILSKEGVPVKNGWTGALERELLWGWKALQQLLLSLGIKMDTA